jgi:hypothetical protein
MQLHFLGVTNPKTLKLFSVPHSAMTAWVRPDQGANQLEAPAPTVGLEGNFQIDEISCSTAHNCGVLEGNVERARN